MSKEAIVIAANIQKGGSGKSTTIQEVGSCLTKLGKRVLVVDLDPQGNVSFSSGIDMAEKTIYRVFKNECTIHDAIVKTNNYDIVPSEILLSGADLEFNKTGRESILRNKLKDVKNEYDYILLDTPPSLGTLSINALTAADYVIIPTEPSYYALNGMTQLYETMNEVLTYCNPNLKIAGILLIKYNNRTNLNKEIKDILLEVSKQMETKVFETFIRESVIVKKAQSLQKSLMEHEPESNPAIDYKEFTYELISTLEGR